ncbi:MAG: toll/interleukin-1 receptor domain-containing protein [Actinomycetota bacterium]
MQTFISYSREDAALVETMRSDLEAMGADPWIDKELSGGQTWWNHVLDRIAAADVFFIAISPASIGSEACIAELSYAKQADRPVVPVRIRGEVSPATAPAPLPEYQWIDYLRRDRDELLLLARSLLTVERRPLPSPRPEPPPVPGSYLVDLRTAIDSPTLTLEAQAGIVHQLRHGVRAGKDRLSLLGLAEVMRGRADLFASVADEIDALLVGERDRPASSGGRPDRARSDETDDEPAEVEPTGGLDRSIIEAVRSTGHAGGTDLHFDPSIPDGKLAKARESSQVPDDERILVLVDCTVFGSAKDCVLFGRSAIYAYHMNADVNPIRVDYGAIAPDAVEVAANKFTRKAVAVGDVEVRTDGSDVKPAELADMIVAVLGAMRSR